MNVSVLIIVYDRPAHLRACLHALSLQTRPADQIVVVDDGSSPAAADAIRDSVAQSGLPIKLVSRVRTGYCPAAARNEAVRHADHEYLLFHDCDILAFPDLIERHLAASDPGLFQIGNCGYLNASRSQPFLEQTNWNAEDLKRAWQAADLSAVNKAARRFCWHSLQRRFGVARRHKPKLLSGHFSLYREDLLEVNGFDEKYVGWGYEDDDLGMRLYLAGLRSHSLIKTARALHLHHPSAKPPAEQGVRPNRIYFRRKDVLVRCERGIVNSASPLDAS